MLFILQIVAKCQNYRAKVGWIKVDGTLFAIEVTGEKCPIQAEFTPKHPCVKLLS